MPRQNEIIGSLDFRICGDDGNLAERQRMELALRGREALITGASRGIGRACAEVLAEAGSCWSRARRPISKPPE